MVVENKHYSVAIDVVFIHSCIEKHLDWLYDLNALSTAVSLKGKNEEPFNLYTQRWHNWITWYFYFYYLE